MILLCVFTVVMTGLGALREEEDRPSADLEAEEAPPTGSGADVGAPTTSDSPNGEGEDGERERERRPDVVIIA